MNNFNKKQTKKNSQYGLIPLLLCCVFQYKSDPEPVCWHHYCLTCQKGQRSVLSIWIFKLLFSNIAIQVSAHSLLDVFVFLLSGLVSVLEYIMFMLIFLFWVTARITSNVLPVQSETLCLSSCLFKAPPLPPNTF